jgi:LmbE family N-acetylglucosaminyl deacetylase
MNVVVLAPHADDEALGCGGTIAKLADNGHAVYVYAFACGTANISEFRNSCCKLGAIAHPFAHFKTREFANHRQAILDCMITIRQQLKPDMVFIPASSDIHQDHHVINQEGIRAFKHSTIYGYELPWNSLRFDNSCYSVLTADHIQKKADALKAYESQKDRIYFKDDAMLSLARVRGIQAGKEYAECFEVIRQFL